MKKRTSESKVQRLVQRVRQKPDRRTTVKVRTLLSAFGYSRRSQEVVRAISQQLAAEGVTVDLSVDTPPTLDGWIELREHSAGQGQSVTPPDAGGEGNSANATVAAVSKPPQGSSGSDVSRSSATSGAASEPAETADGDLPSPPSGFAEADARRVVSDLKNEQASVPSVEAGGGAEANNESTRSFAARLFIAALSLLKNAPPTTLGLPEGAEEPLPSPSSVAPPSAGSEPASSNPKPSSSLGPRPAMPAPSVPKPIPVAPDAGPSASVTPGTPELSSVAEQTIQATVFVQVEHGHGSGFIVHPDGLVVTACHVLDGPSGIAKSATIRTHDGRETTASLLRAHRSLDFALLWVDKSDRYPSLRVGEASRTRYADTVLAVGHPGLGGGRALRNTVSTGVVANPACTERGIEWIQMTTDIDPGNSGGPLVNRAGEVIGINCWKFAAVAAAKMALPMDYLREDLVLAMERGRGAQAGGHVCSICGWFDSEPFDWFCPTCGAAHAMQPDGATKGN